MVRRYTVSVIGEGAIDSNDPRYCAAVDMGRILIDKGYRLVTGGLGGIMEAASRGARSSLKYREGDIVGILPGEDTFHSNEFVDISIPTGLGIGRNLLVTNTDAIIAVGGGAGTLSEIAFAWQKGKLIIAFRVEGWSGKLADLKIDERKRSVDIEDDRIFGVDTPVEAGKILDDLIEFYSPV